MKRRALVHALAGLCVCGVALPAPAQFADFIRKEHAKWGGAVRDAGIKLD